VTEASDVRTLEAGADVVFVGTVTAKTGQRLDDLQGALASTAKSPMPVSQFSVSVEQVLSGDLQAGDEVWFEQVGGTSPVSGGKIATFALDGDTLMQAGGRYLFFARRTPGGAYSVAPYGRFPLEGDTLKAPPGWERVGAATQLAGADLQVAWQEVQGNAR
jgi:hypothetical protein